MKVLITDPIAEEGIEILREGGLEVETAYGLKGHALIEKIGDFDALIVRSATKVTREVIETGEKLKVIGRAGVGLDNIDLEAARERGIEVVNTPGATAISVAELTIGMMIACARNIVRGTLGIKSSLWEKKALKGIELSGKRAGIIGLGRIGREVAKRLRCLGMEVVYYDPLVSESDLAMRLEFDELIRTSDFITLHLPLTEQTHHLIGEREFEKMKEGVILVNCARGGIVDEEALYHALKSGKVRAAGLDVFEVEPLNRSKLIELNNVVLTPHIGAQTVEGQKRAGIEIARKVLEALKGR